MVLHPNNRKLFECMVSLSVEYLGLSTKIYCQNDAFSHGWLDTAVVLYCCHFVLLRKIELFVTTEELA